MCRLSPRLREPVRAGARRSDVGGLRRSAAGARVRGGSKPPSGSRRDGGRDGRLPRSARVSPSRLEPAQSSARKAPRVRSGCARPPVGRDRPPARRPDDRRGARRRRPSRDRTPVRRSGSRPRARVARFAAGPCGGCPGVGGRLHGRRDRVATIARSRRPGRESPPLRRLRPRREGDVRRRAPALLRDLADRLLPLLARGGARGDEDALRREGIRYAVSP